ncbi:MAG: SPOR domain-containing protein [Deltaproteobacteria bacterium]|jgi:cell division septation protein DedD|nr:SPOR domain-containing protein [Deltaproteobacteria bacterium]
MLSAVFLVWIFLLGVLVGRGTLLNAPAPVQDPAPLQGWIHAEPPRSAALQDGAYPQAAPDVLADPLPAPSPYGGEAVYLGDTEGGTAYAYIPPGEDAYPEGSGPGTTDDPAAYPPAEASSDTGGALAGAGGVDFFPAVAPAAVPASAAAPVPAARPSPSPAQGRDLASAPPLAPAGDTDPVAALQARRQAAAARPAADETVYWPKPPSGKGQYTVQVASPVSEEEARHLAEGYRKRGFDAYYYSTGKGRFPTRVGRYQTAKEAEEARARLAEAGSNGPYVSKLNL